MGLLGSGTGKVHKLADLTPESRRKIERSIFGTLPAEENEYYRLIQNRAAVDDWQYESDSEDDFHPSTLEPIDFSAIAIEQEGTATLPELSLEWDSFYRLFNSRTLPETRATQGDGHKALMPLTTNRPLVEQYISMVCQYLNERRIPGSDEGVKSCVMMSQDHVDTINNAIHNSREGTDLAEVIETEFKIMHFSTEEFMKLDYFFCPHLVAGHYKLLGFAPKQRTAFAVDSIPGDLLGYNLERSFLLAILNHLVPDEDDRKQWDLDTNKVRKGDKERSTAVEQRDLYNCGVYTATNATLLAFGYDLKCFVARDLDQFRKKRMVAELKNGGFSGLYKYDLIEYPAPRVVTGPSKDWERLEDAMEAEKKEMKKEEERRKEEEDGKSDDKLESDDEEDVEDSDDEEAVDENDDADQHGFEDDIVFDTTTSKTAALPSKILFPTASQCLAKDLLSTELRPESIERAPAPQFSGPDFTRYRFMYSFPHINFKEAVQASKEDMIEACKNFPLANWEQWSVHPKDFFLRWMMTEMGATMARIHKDPVQPCPGLGDGYEIWLKWQSEKTELEKKSEPKDIPEQVVEIDVSEDSTSTTVSETSYSQKSPPTATSKRGSEEDSETLVPETVKVSSQDARRKRRRTKKALIKDSMDSDEEV